MIKARSISPHIAPGLTEDMKPRMEIDTHNIRHDFCTSLRMLEIISCIKESG